jgi:hypothetical protein
MKFENTEVWGFQHAIRGMGNSHESWEKSDSYQKDTSFCLCPTKGARIYADDDKEIMFFIGTNDLHLMQALIKAGSEHRKFMQQIFVSVDITAPLCWWEGVRHQIGTVSDSCSTMHKLASTPITRECFEMDDFEEVRIDMSINNFWESYLIPTLEQLRQKYNELMEDKRQLEEIKEFDEAKKAQVMAKKYWKELVRLLPESWLQKRTITMSYENVLTMVRQRKNHKLTEWSEKFIEWARTLPYADELLFMEGRK